MEIGIKKTDAKVESIVTSRKNAIHIEVKKFY